jgi:hypothetical protein
MPMYVAHNSLVNGWPDTIILIVHDVHPCTPLIRGSIRIGFEQTTFEQNVSMAVWSSVGSHDELKMPGSPIPTSYKYLSKIGFDIDVVDVAASW